MKTRFLRNIEVSEVGMGCMAFSHGYGKIPDEEYSIEAIRNAYGHGCTFFDTAEVYSPNLSGIGHNERIVGKALEPFRNDVVIATEFVGNYASVDFHHRALICPSYKQKSQIKSDFFGAGNIPLLFRKRLPRLLRRVISSNFA